MASYFGENIRFSVFGESHGRGIGVVVDSLPAGEKIDLGALDAFLSRRAPGRNDISTARQEPDSVEFLSGIVDGVTTGSPIAALIRNRDTRSGDYSDFANLPRPSHADFTARRKFGPANDFRGGGHFSGRLTAPLCVAGGLCLQILARRGITVGAHLAEVDGVPDRPFDPVSLDRETLLLAGRKPFPALDDAAGEQMRARILEAGSEGDSVGGVIEVGAVGLPAGLGAPMFGGLEGRVAQAVFGVPGVRGVEFGTGFRAARMRGSAHNDAFCLRDGEVRTQTNHAGGVLGGITSGMPVLFRVAMKPTASIAARQNSVLLDEMRETTVEIRGRHDPCIAPRAVPVMEAVLAAVLLDMDQKE